MGNSRNSDAGKTAPSKRAEKYSKSWDKASEVQHPTDSQDAWRLGCDLGVFRRLWNMDQDFARISPSTGEKSQVGSSISGPACNPRACPMVRKKQDFGRLISGSLDRSYPLASSGAFFRGHLHAKAFHPEAPTRETRVWGGNPQQDSTSGMGRKPSSWTPHQETNRGIVEYWYGIQITRCLLQISIDSKNLRHWAKVGMATQNSWTLLCICCPIMYELMHVHVFHR